MRLSETINERIFDHFLKKDNRKIYKTTSSSIKNKKFKERLIIFYYLSGSK